MSVVETSTIISHQHSEAAVKMFILSRTGSSGESHSSLGGAVSQGRKWRKNEGELSKKQSPALGHEASQRTTNGLVAAGKAHLCTWARASHIESGLVWWRPAFSETSTAVAIQEMKSCRP